MGNNVNEMVNEAVEVVVETPVNGCGTILTTVVTAAATTVVIKVLEVGGKKLFTVFKEKKAKKKGLNDSEHEAEVIEAVNGEDTEENDEE